MCIAIAVTTLTVGAILGAVALGICAASRGN
jgi:hypothetical protein